MRTGWAMTTFVLSFSFPFNFHDLSTCLVHKGYNCVEAFRHFFSSNFLLQMHADVFSLSCGLLCVCVCKLVFHL